MKDTIGQPGDVVTFPGYSAPRALYTERQKVLAEREAFREGVAAERAALFNKTPETTIRTRYPLPKVTQRRVLDWTSPTGVLVQFMVGAVDGLISRAATDAKFCGWVGDKWEGDVFTRYASAFAKNPALLRSIADLLANPTEEVDE